MLLVISSLPGVGKTTVARLVAERIGATHLSVDPVENAIVAAGCPSGWTTGVAAYEAVRAMAELNLHAGHDVVVDAVNDSEPARDTWRRAAAASGVELRWVVLTVSDASAHFARLEGRDRGFAHVGEPAWSEVVARAMAAWTDPHLLIDTAGLDAHEAAASILNDLWE